MAILSTTRKAYRGNYTPLGNCVGYESGLSTASVMRYKFTTDEKGATKVRFQTSNCNLVYFQEGDSGAYDTIAKIRFIITAQATGYETYHGSAGTKCQYDYGDWLKGEIEMDLLPNTDYYLWIFPNFGGFAVWGIGSCTVETEGVYGQPSTISANDGYLGEDIPISITRGLDVMLHTVKVECAGLTKVLAEQSAQSPTFVWQPSIAEYAPLITKAAAADAVISVETFLNGNSLGVSTKTIKVKIPETALLPQISDGWVNAAPYNTGKASGFTVYIRTYSRAQITFDESKIDMSGTEGGSIAGYEITCNGSTVKESPYLTPVLSAETSVVCDVIDSRGRRISKTIKITPLPYSTPSLTQIGVERCDNTGALTEDGYYHKVSATAIYSTLSGQNGITLRTAFRNLQGSFGSYSNLESGKAAVIYGTRPDASYEVRIEVTDKLGNSSSATRRLPTRQWAMKFRADAQGVAFGKAPEFEKAMELPEDWTVRRGLEDRVMWASGIQTFTGTLLASGWTSVSWGCYQTIDFPNSGILAHSSANAVNQHVEVGLNTGSYGQGGANSQVIEVDEAWSNVFRAIPYANSVQFNAKEIPTVDIPVYAWVVNK